ncbi:hypothetical protein PROVRUST_06062 [Providencia rustigianii DSM 4541]|uniref:Uncharacterized protein n=1 Tax=Providencia rustigianii DSM 4541 TaxID=500637 RepID=D1P1J1_9GAMM|nr:hypothetical protein PROVRUST_06062 [Providencia rustigianii DSM 4541]
MAFILSPSNYPIVKFFDDHSHNSPTVFYLKKGMLVTVTF